METEKTQSMGNFAVVPVQATNINNVLTHNSTPDKEGETPLLQQEQYLKTLFRRCKDGYIEIRVLSEEWKIVDRKWYPVETMCVEKLPADKHNFIGVATRKNGEGGKAGIVEIPAVWVDIDFKNINRNEVDRRIADFSLPPSTVVNSGKGYHLYWILEIPVTQNEIPKIEDINKRLVNHFGGDRGSADASHILRLPETYNIKYNPPCLVNISSINDETYHIDDFGFLPPVEPPKPFEDLSLGTLEEWHTQILRGVNEGERHTSVVRLAGRYQRKGLTEDEVQILMAQWNEKNKPPLSGKELSRTITNIFSSNQRNDENTENSLLQNFCSDIELSIMSVPAFMRKQLPIKPYIIDPLLKKGEIMMISAARGVGKTWFALSIGFMATRQTKIGKWETSTLTPTLYVDGEMSVEEMQKRILGLKIGRQAEQEPLYLLSSDEMRSNDRKSPNLNNPVWRASISGYLKSHPDLGLVILDNLASLTPGRDENKKRDWDDINGWLLDLRSKGVAVIFLHHEGKGGEQRGTSAIEDNINFSIKLKHPEGYRREDGAKFVVEFTKSRRLYGDDAKSFTLQLQNTESGLDWECMTDDKAQDENRIIDMWREGVKQKNIAETLGVTASWVSQVLKKVKSEEKSRRVETVLGNDEDQTDDFINTVEVETVCYQN